MLYPSIDHLLSKVDTKYSLVVATAKRARSLKQGAELFVKSKSGKPVTQALEEISQGKVNYVRTREGAIK